MDTPAPRSEPLSPVTSDQSEVQRLRLRVVQQEQAIKELGVSLAAVLGKVSALEGRVQGLIATAN